MYIAYAIAAKSGRANGFRVAQVEIDEEATIKRLKEKPMVLTYNRNKSEFSDIAIKTEKIFDCPVGTITEALRNGISIVPLRLSAEEKIEADIFNLEDYPVVSWGTNKIIRGKASNNNTRERRN